MQLWSMKPRSQQHYTRRLRVSYEAHRRPIICACQEVLHSAVHFGVDCLVLAAMKTLNTYAALLLFTSFFALVDWDVPE